MGYVILLWHSLGLPYNYFLVNVAVVAVVNVDVVAVVNVAVVAVVKVEARSD